MLLSADPTPLAAERLPLKDAVQTSLTEARMVLPGMQAIFGFQLIAFFNERFDTALTDADRWVHWTAVLALVVAMGLIMAPAAYHREVHEGEVSPALLRLTSRLVRWALAPLTAAIALEVYVVTRLVTPSPWLPAGAALLAAAWFTGLWFAFPALARRARRRRAA